MASPACWNPVWIARSDGELEIKTKKYGRENNGPTDSQLDKNSNEDDYYELVPIDAPTAVEWKRILAGMLHREQRGPPDQAWILVDFPENYRLYKHIKKERADESAKPAKTSSKGSNSEEAYLYGYPMGRKKRFRSALEFFPHLLWLAEGTSDDRRDCCCKHCAPDWIQAIQPLPGREGFVPAKKEHMPVKKEAVTTSKDAPISKPQVVIKQRSTSQENNKSPKVTSKVPPPAPKVTPVASKTPLPASKVPPTVSRSGPPLDVASVPRSPAPALSLPASTALPSAKSWEQDLDAQYGKYIYRPGELTWFNRGSAWGLSVVTMRELFKDARNQDRPRYLVQPLSHPFNHPSTKTISSEEDLRPWLAWSAPGATHQPLAPLGLTYSTVDWEAVLEGRFGVGDAEVDGSIYAAKMIDDSFTLIGPVSNNTITTGERSYNGMYIGGEKFWVGEAIRLRIGNGNDVMIVHQIIEKLKPNSTNASSATVFVVGDIYRYSTIPYTIGTEPSENPNLPIRLRQDLTYRNRLTIASKRIVSYWKLISPAARLGIADIKGRWYESSILLPILHGAASFQQDLQRGDITDVGLWINGRGDANSTPGKAGTRYKDRLEAFNRAVPATTKISKGLDGPAEENVFPASPSAPRPVVMANQPVTEAGGGQGQPLQGVTDGNIDDFMDLDRMEGEFAHNLHLAGHY